MTTFSGRAALVTGGVQILVHCAGITDRRRLLDCDLESWRRLFAVNVEGALLGVRVVAPALPRWNARPLVSGSTRSVRVCS